MSIILGIITLLCSFLASTRLALGIEVRAPDAANRWIMRLFVLLVAFALALLISKTMAGSYIWIPLLTGSVLGIFCAPFWLLPKVFILDEPTWSKLKELT